MTDTLTWEDYDCRADFIISQKFISGEWYAKPATGEIFNKYDHQVKGSILNGYFYVGTTWNGLSISVAIHRAIWISTHGCLAIPPGMQIDHINGIKTDNRIDNLRMVTARENSMNPNTLRTGARHSHAKLTPEQVRELRRLASEGKTQRELAWIYNISQQTAGKIANGFRYKEVV